MSKALSKSQVAAEVAAKAGLSKKQAVEILDHIAQFGLGKNCSIDLGHRGGSSIAFCDVSFLHLGEFPFGIAEREDVIRLAGNNADGVAEADPADVGTVGEVVDRIISKGGPKLAARPSRECHGARPAIG